MKEGAAKALQVKVQSDFGNACLQRESGGKKEKRARVCLQRLGGGQDSEVVPETSWGGGRAKREDVKKEQRTFVSFLADAGAGGMQSVYTVHISIY